MKFAVVIVIPFVVWKVNSVKIISEDVYANSGSQHNTQVEPCSFAYNKTVIAAVQTGRYKLPVL